MPGSASNLPFAASVIPDALFTNFRRFTSMSAPPGAAQSPCAHASARHGSSLSHATQQPGGETCLHCADASSQESTVQARASAQLGGVPAVQVPLWQVSAPLQNDASA